MIHVLIVDDDPLMRAVLSKIISENEKFFVIGEVENGLEAIKICQNHIIDLIFLDIVMPQINGIEVAKRIAKISPRTNICFVSAYSEANYMKQIMNLSIKKYFPKPVQRKDILSYLDHYQEFSQADLRTTPKYTLSLENTTFCQLIDSASEQIAFLCKHQNFTRDYLYDQLTAMAQDLYNQVTLGYDQIKILELYPLQRDWVEEPELVKLWLFQIINYVWQQKSIQRHDVLKLVFHYIDHHIKESITLTDIVKNCLLSQGYLSRIFRDQFDISVMEYIKMRKIHMMKVNLLFTSTSISDIAEYLGYSDPKYMGKIFKKEEGVSLNEYRKMLM